MTKTTDNQQKFKKLGGQVPISVKGMCMTQYLAAHVALNRGGRKINIGKAHARKMKARGWIDDNMNLTELGVAFYLVIRDKFDHLQQNPTESPTEADHEEDDEDEDGIVEQVNTGSHELATLLEQIIAG